MLMKHVIFIYKKGSHKLNTSGRRRRRGNTSILSKEDRKIDIGSLRRTQIITTFGPGSIVDMKDFTVTLAGLDKWQAGLDNTINEYNLQRQLKVNYFISPKASNDVMFKKSEDMQAYIFPEYWLCTNCGCIANYKEFTKFGLERKSCPLCHEKNDKIVSSRFIIACDDGHMDDFPYHWWVHREVSDDEKHICKPERLKMINFGTTGGIDAIGIKCLTCKKVVSMKSIFSKNALEGYSCTKKRPWLNDIDNNCEATKPKVLMSKGTNVYFSKHESTLSIPPWSNKIQKIIRIPEIWDSIKPIADESGLENFIRTNWKRDFQFTLGDLSESKVKDVIRQINRRKKSYGPISKEEIRQEEYKALIGGNQDDDEFKTIRHTNLSPTLSSHITSLTAVRKLREVMALVDFDRITPKDLGNESNSYTKLAKRQDLGWLPAIELFGEGIFIEFSESKLVEWENRSNVLKRYHLIEDNLRNSIIQKRNLSPRYVLLHTLAHLLIKQLVVSSGYGSASLKERIYATYSEDQVENPISMSGILIYTASSDADGSLGGLVSQIDNLEGIIHNMLNESSWCTNDPLCITSKGQGIDNLNLAACHSCVLLPETSCESRNIFLDRAFVVGDLDDDTISFFKDYK